MARMKRNPCRYCKGTGKEFNHEAVGAHLRTLRRELKISQTKVANRMRFSKPYICDLEHGYRNWTEKLIAKYRKAIGA